MQKKKIANTKDSYLVSSDTNSGDGCPVCLLIKKCEDANVEPTLDEIKKAMKEAEEDGAIML